MFCSDELKLAFTGTPRIDISFRAKGQGRAGLSRVCNSSSAAENAYRMRYGDYYLRRQPDAIHSVIDWPLPLSQGRFLLVLRKENK